mmetsp:Transcript_96186/g.190631  ORF Transcript_96186/g.190631 Transcript_96186/m.190631 type:complete len:260 (+) Transcript_96186:1-780(+)
MLWILPYAQIGNTFKTTWKENEEAVKLRADVKLEDSRSPDKVWIEEGGTPTVPIEIWESAGSTRAEHGSLAGVGAVPVPILEKTYRSSVVSTDLWGGSMQPCYGGAPSMDLHVRWHPTEVKDGTSHGTLTLQPLRGHNFQGSGDSTRWECNVRIPLGLVPQHAGPGHSWESGLSIGGAPSPSWDGQAGTFNITLNAGVKEDKDKATKQAAMSNNEDTMQPLNKVLRFLEAHERQLNDLSFRTESIFHRTVAIENNITKT